MMRIDARQFFAIVAVFTIFGCATGSTKEQMTTQQPAHEKQLPRPTAQDLIDAAKRGDLPQVQRLIAKGADVNAKGEYTNSTPLFASIEGGHREVVELLLAKGADVNARQTGMNQTPLMMASWNGHLEIVQALLANGADVNATAWNLEYQTALMMASWKGHLEIVQTLLANGADVNANYRGSPGRSHTSLMLASEKGHTDIVQALLAKGADVNAKGDLGGTALIYASSSGHLEIVRALLSNGADVNARTNPIHGFTVGNDGVKRPFESKGVTALKAASGGGYKDIVVLLRKHGGHE